MARSSQDDAEPLDLEAVERNLRDRCEQLRDRLASMSKPPERGAEIGFGKRIGEGTTEAISRLTDVGVGGSLEVTEDRTTRALDKLAEGTYGICDPAAVQLTSPEALIVIPGGALTSDHVIGAVPGGLCLVGVGLTGESGRRRRGRDRRGVHR